MQPLSKIVLSLKQLFKILRSVLKLSLTGAKDTNEKLWRSKLKESSKKLSNYSKRQMNWNQITLLLCSCLTHVQKKWCRKKKVFQRERCLSEIYLWRAMAMKTKTHLVLAALPSVRMTQRSQNGWRKILCSVINSKCSEWTLIWSCSWSARILVGWRYSKLWQASIWVCLTKLNNKNKMMKMQDKRKWKKNIYKEKLKKRSNERKRKLQN